MRKQIVLGLETTDYQDVFSFVICFKIKIERRCILGKVRWVEVITAGSWLQWVKRFWQQGANAKES